MPFKHPKATSKHVQSSKVVSTLQNHFQAVKIFILVIAAGFFIEILICV